MLKSAEKSPTTMITSTHFPAEDARSSLHWISAAQGARHAAACEESKDDSGRRKHGNTDPREELQSGPRTVIQALFARHVAVLFCKGHSS